VPTAVESAGLIQDGVRDQVSGRERLLVGEYRGSRTMAQQGMGSDDGAARRGAGEARLWGQGAMTPRQRYKCPCCGLILNAWLPAFRAPNGALLLGHLTQHHRSESRRYLQRLRDTNEEIATVAAEAFAVIEGEKEEGRPEP
jgi:hypothetical protein